MKYAEVYLQKLRDPKDKSSGVIQEWVPKRISDIRERHRGQIRCHHCHVKVDAHLKDDVLEPHFEHAQNTKEEAESSGCPTLRKDWDEEAYWVNYFDEKESA